MAVNLINIIDALDLEELTQAISNDGKGKEETPQILKDFENACRQATEEVKDGPTSENFSEKLALLLSYYDDELSQEVYLKLYNLKVRLEPSLEILHSLEQRVLDKISEQPGEIRKLQLLAIISRVFTPNQEGVTDETTAAEKVAVLDDQYAPLIAPNIKISLDQFYNGVLDIAKDDSIALRVKVENMVSLYEEYKVTLKSEIEALFSLSNRSFHDYFSGKIEEKDKAFFEENLIKELADAYLNMCFQYMNTKIKYGVDGFRHDQILKLTIDSMLTTLRSTEGHAQSKMISKLVDSLDLQKGTAFLALREINESKIVTLEKRLAINIRDLWNLLHSDKKYKAIAKILEEKLKEQSTQKRIEAVEAIKKVIEDKKKYKDVNPLIENAINTIAAIRSNETSEAEKELESKIDNANQLILLLQTGNMGEREGSTMNAASESSTAATSRITSPERKPTPSAGLEQDSSNRFAPARKRVGGAPSSAPGPALEPEKRVQISGQRSISMRSAPGPALEPEKRVQLGGYRRPVDSAPVSPAPVSPAPVSPAPVSPAPVSSSPYAMFSQHSSGSSTSTSPAFARHRDPAPASPAPASPAPASLAPASLAPANADPNDKAGTTTMKKG